MKKVNQYLMFSVGMIVMLALESCSKSNSSLPPINGYNSSDDIQKDKLAAHWSFENNFNESVQSLTPTSSSTAPTFATGIKGKAYQGGGNTYLSFPQGTLGSLQSLTVSMWFNQPAKPVNNTTASYIAGQGPQGMLFMYNSATWENVQIDNEPYEPKSGDSLRIHAGFSANTSAVGGPWANVQENVISECFATNALTKWTHFVMTYDGGTSTFTLYQNGIVIGANTAWSNPKTAAAVQLLTGPSTDTASKPYGNLNLNNPQGLIIGGFPQVLNNTSLTFSPNTPQAWTGNWQGALDEIRIYKTSLTAVEVGSLYQLELAGR